MTTLEQNRARHALGKINELAGNDAHEYGNYVSFVKSLPASILQNGLGQALATELAASGDDSDTEKGHKHLCKHVCSWLGANADHAPYRGETEPKDLLEKMMEEEEPAYLRAQAEALAYLAWLKKFAVALLVQPEIGRQQAGEGDEQ